MGDSAILTACDQKSFKTSLNNGDFSLMLSTEQKGLVIEVALLSSRFEIRRTIISAKEVRQITGAQSVINLNKCNTLVPYIVYNTSYCTVYTT